MDRHRDGVESFVGGAVVGAVAGVECDIGEVEFRSVGEEVACGGEDGGGFGRALEVIGTPVELGQRGELEVVEDEGDIDGFVGVIGVESADAADTEGDGFEGRPEGVEGVDGERIAVDEQGLFEGGIAVEEHLLVKPGTIFRAEINAIGEEVAELGIAGVGDDTAHEAGIVEDEGAGQGFGHLDVFRLANGKRKNSA